MRISCPSCGTTKKEVPAGKYICKKCNTQFIVTADRDVLEGGMRIYAKKIKKIHNGLVTLTLLSLLVFIPAVLLLIAFWMSGTAIFKFISGILFCIFLLFQAGIYIRQEYVWICPNCLEPLPRYKGRLYFDKRCGSCGILMR